MALAFTHKITEKLKWLFKKRLNNIFKKSKGVIHVGANTGQEISFYARFKLPVVWIEPIPEIFEKLQSNLSDFPDQIAIQGLVTDLDDTAFNFHVASNNGASSSILELNLHQDIWPEVTYKESIQIASKTLPTLLREYNIDLMHYDILVMDTQGSELLILKGAVSILSHFKYIKTEVPDFESYKGCCQLKDLESFLSVNGFKELNRQRFASHPNGGNYYDIIYMKS